MSSPPPSHQPPSDQEPPRQGWGLPPHREPQPPPASGRPTAAQWGAPPPRPPHPPRPWYRRPWFVILAAVLALFIILGIVGSVVGAPTTTVTTTTIPATAAPAPTTQTTIAPTTTVPPTTARPTTTRAPTTTRPPTTQPPAPALSVRIVSLPATGQGNPATATVQTAPRASCSIDVEYKSGPSQAAGLDPKTASGTGVVSWTWLVGTRTTPGEWPVTVTCSKGSDSQSDQRDLTVLDTGKPG
jgi:hypothetical protein